MRIVLATRLQAFGQEPRFSEILRAYYIGHLGKYVPGKAMVVVLRTGLLKSHRVDAAVATISVVYETLTMMAVGGFLASAILLVGFRHEWKLAVLSAGLMLVALLPTLPPVFKRLALLVGIGRRDPGLAERLQTLGLRPLALGWLTIALGWALMGLSLWATLCAMGLGDTLPWRQLPLLTATVSLAMVAGFLSLIPGGALVRESVVLGLLRPEVGEASALVAALLLRLVWLASEIVLSATLFWCGRRGKPRDAATTDTSHCEEKPSASP